MEKKSTTTSFNLNGTLKSDTKPNIFDRIIKEIEANEIPSKYVEQILVHYYDGTVVELKGEELTHPIPVNRNATWATMENSFKQMKDVKIIISLDRLEKDINIMVEAVLGKFC